MTKSKKSIALVLRTCRSNLTSRDGFQWADVGGTTVAEDWVKNTNCGNGLHGWLFGAGDHNCSDYLAEDSKWMVLEVDLKNPNFTIKAGYKDYQGTNWGMQSTTDQAAAAENKLKQQNPKKLI